MLVLAIDTSTKMGSVALYNDASDGLVGEINLNLKQNHSVTIMESIDALFKLTGYTVKEVDKIAVSIGPGSFTGIRIGVGVAKGLAYSLDKPIVGINELDLIAANSIAGEYDVIPLIDARKERAYYSIYRYEDTKLVKIEEYKDGELKDILSSQKGRKTLFLGDGALAYRKIIEEAMGEKAVFSTVSGSLPRGAVLGEMALHKEEDNLFVIEPFYVNRSQAEREKGITI